MIRTTDTPEFVNSDDGQVLDFDIMATILARAVSPYDCDYEHIMEYQRAQLWMMTATFKTYIAADMTTCAYTDDVIKSYKEHRKNTICSWYNIDYIGGITKVG